jgi:formyl-CoA transferase
VLLAIQNQPEWVRLCTQVLELPELVDDRRFAKNPARVAHRDELEAIITAAVEPFSADELEKRLEDAGIANARMNTMAQLWHHPVLSERDRWRDVTTPGGQIRALLPPANLSEVHPRMDPVPGLGEHTESILRELGRSEQDIDRLRTEHVVG